MKEFETPEIKEIKLQDLNRADECIKVSVCRYQELLDAETRLDAIVDYLNLSAIAHSIGEISHFTSHLQENSAVTLALSTYNLHLFFIPFAKKEIE